METKVEKKKLKIAFLSFYSGEVYRGVETFVHELANRLTGLGHEITVYQNGPKIAGSAYKTISVGLPIDWSKKASYIPFFNYYALQAKKFTSKALAMMDNSPDIVFPTNGQWTSILTSLWAKTHLVKLAMVGQSGLGRDDRINLWTFPDVFFALTEHQRKWARRANPFVRVEKVRNGADLTKFTTKVAPYNFKVPQPIILSVGALVSWKRHDLTIKAAARLKDASLVLVGKGEDEGKLRGLGERLLPGRFEILSFKHSQMPAVYAGAAVFTYPTVPWESFGIVLVEAMASGVPVVATKDQIREEIVGDAGILADPRDTDAYAEAIKKALATKWGNRPRAQAEKFDWDVIAGKYEKIFLGLVNK